MSLPCPVAALAKNKERLPFSARRAVSVLPSGENVGGKAGNVRPVAAVMEVEAGAGWTPEAPFTPPEIPLLETPLPTKWTSLPVMSLIQSALPFPTV